MNGLVLLFGLVVVLPLWLLAARWLSSKGAEHGRALAEWQLRRRDQRGRR
jgi:hypothetical protein